MCAVLRRRGAFLMPAAVRRTALHGHARRYRGQVCAVNQDSAYSSVHSGTSPVIPLERLLPGVSHVLLESMLCLQLEHVHVHCMPLFLLSTRQPPFRLPCTGCMAW